ncbi:MAG: 5'/3'-nucleotidase SurE [Candidatus Paceibacterota bacterium]
MKVLLTNDDGYQALGLRILASILKEKFDKIIIAAPKTQQSSTGGSFPGKGHWGKDQIDDTEVLWVDGPPSDAVELAGELYGSDFDLIFSGMNMGTNVGSVPASGTLGAANHALEKAIAAKALVFSWRVPEKLWDKTAPDAILADYQDYPTPTVRRIIELTLENNFWGAELLNFNIPEKKPEFLRICKPAKQAYKKYYAYTMEVDHETRTYQKIGADPRPLAGDLNFDANALSQGYATVVPWLSNRYVNQDLLNLIGTEIKL